MSDHDVIVIGGGIAGVSAAAEIAKNARVLLLEREDALARHATGRSAAFLALEYGNATVRELTRRSAEVYFSPPAGFAPAPLVRRRTQMTIARADQHAAFEAAFAQAADPRRLTPDDAVRRAPILRPGYVAEAFEISGGGDLDVDLIVQAYARRFRARGGVLQTRAEVKSLAREADVWVVKTGDETHLAPVVVDAAGAWADAVAALAGLAPLGLAPLRRTAVLIDAPGGLDIGDWPFVFDVDEQFYFKPDAGAVMVCPADETPSPPMDAWAEEMDIAIAVDRFQQATTVEVSRVKASWAGLRTFAPDRTPILGFDPRAAGFFWLAGQGGYGVQSAPAMASLAAAVVSGRGAAEDAALLSALDPRRFIGG